LRFQIRSLEAKVARDKSAYDVKEENLDHTDEDSDDDNDEEADGKTEAITPNIKSPAYAPYSPRIDIRTHKVSTEQSGLAKCIEITSTLISERKNRLREHNEKKDGDLRRLAKMEQEVCKITDEWETEMGLKPRKLKRKRN